MHRRHETKAVDSSDAYVVLKRRKSTKHVERNGQYRWQHSLMVVFATSIHMIEQTRRQQGKSLVGTSPRPTASATCVACGGGLGRKQGGTLSKLFPVSDPLEIESRRDSRTYAVLAALKTPQRKRFAPTSLPECYKRQKHTHSGTWPSDAAVALVLY